MAKAKNIFQVERYYNNSSERFEIRISSPDQNLMDLVYLKIKELVQ